MTILDKIMWASVGWFVLSVFCNPFLENQKLRYVTIGFGALATIIWIIR